MLELCLGANVHQFIQPWVRKHIITRMIPIPIYCIGICISQSINVTVPPRVSTVCGNSWAATSLSQWQVLHCRKNGSFRATIAFVIEASVGWYIRGYDRKDVLFGLLWFFCQNQACGKIKSPVSWTVMSTLPNLLPRLLTMAFSTISCWCEMSSRCKLVQFHIILVWVVWIWS